MKGGWTCKNDTHSIQEHYRNLLGSCQSYLDSFAAIPILYDYFSSTEKAIRRLVDQKGLSQAIPAEALERKDKFVSGGSKLFSTAPETYTMLQSVYGLSAGMIEQAVARLESVVTVPALILCPLLERIILTDVDASSRDMGWNLHRHENNSYYCSAFSDVKDTCFCAEDFSAKKKNESKGFIKWVRQRTTASNCTRIVKKMMSRRDIANLGAVACPNGA